MDLFTSVSLTFMYSGSSSEISAFCSRWKMDSNSHSWRALLPSVAYFMAIKQLAFFSDQVLALKASQPDMRYFSAHKCKRWS